MRKRFASRLISLIGLITFFLFFGAVAFLALLGPAIGNTFSSINTNLAYGGSASVSSASLTATPLAMMLASDQRQALPTQEAARVASTGGRSEPAAQPQRIILRNASLTITVDDPIAKIDDIMDMANAMGGWVISSNTRSYNNSAGAEVTSGNVAVRVPAERLDEALERIKSSTLEVGAESITGQDVTQEYVDISSRLSNLKASETQLQAIMQTAETVEDVLAVQHELTNVRSEIEILQGRINFFDESAAFSSIRVEVRPPEPGPVERQSAVWSPASTAENALGRLVGVIQFVVDAGINIVIILLPFVILIGIPTWVIRRRRQRKAA